MATEGKWSQKANGHRRHYVMKTAGLRKAFYEGTWFTSISEEKAADP